VIPSENAVNSIANCIDLLPVLNPSAPTNAQRTLALLLPDLLPKLRSFLLKRISNPADAEDLAQDILLRVHQSADQLADETRIHGWIWQIARNTVIDFYRRNRATSVVLGEVDLPVDDHAPDVEEIVESWLAPMIAELPETYRAAVRMSELEGIPQLEIAERLSMTLSGVKSRIQRGRAKLREAMMSCCQFEFDRDGRITGFHRKASDCFLGEC
jgi:RNA polymerase sigma-70 factor (ECF subfamily)